MSQSPPPPPGNYDFDGTLPYQSTPPSHTMAMTAMILGIVSFPLVCVVLGVFLALGAIILGIIALVSISRNPVQYSGKGMAIAGIATGAGAIFIMVPLLIAIMLPSLGKSRELSQRSLCAANLRGIMQSIVVYANDNADSFPYLGPQPIAAKPPLENTPGGLMHDMFVLVGNGMVSPKQFICKSDPANTAPSNVPTPGPGISYTPSYWTHPGGGDPNLCYSYSFAYQYSKPDELAGWHRNIFDAAVPLIADMNPGDQNPKPVKNSLNHQGDGQLVAFGDAHVEFSRTPACGENNDNIYNTGSNNPATPGALGQPPFASAAGTTPGAFDTHLVPGIADTTTYTRK
jgi:hypothetical protein